MEEKEFKIVVVFGESAAKAYYKAWECDKQMSESELKNMGCVIRRSFGTEAERNAYIQALEDSDGWFDYAVAEEKYLTY